MVGDMGIFKRSRGGASAAAAIGAFWEQWPGLRDSVEGSVQGSGGEGAGGTVPDEVRERLDELVRAVHPELTWELDAERRVLTLTGGGLAEARGAAERWRKKRPKRDPWTFHAARQPDPGRLEGRLALGDHDFDLSYVKFGMRVDQARARVDISAYHPDFLFVDDETRLKVAFRVLDWALGEDDVARWIGEVTIAVEPPIDSLPPSLLASVVEQIAEPFKEGAWLTGEGRTPRGHPAQLAVRFPLHRQDHPLCEVHVAVSLPYAHSNPDLLPVGSSASALREAEKRLDSLPGTVLALRETGDGRRVFHLYADPDSGALAELDQFAASWPEGRAKVESQPDPSWQALAPYRH
ncbi:hypothetical protein GCM10010439_27280 [Actinocorallia aurantiaca]|uniref:DUF695 domain-containing protein n=2 Tax=Actinocorallia aurantiaca TaxID=46204 RepID=A0ABN3U7Y8_9ACTN